MKLCYECRKKPRQRCALCYECYEIVKPRFGHEIGERVWQFPFTLKDGALWSAACEVTDVMEYAVLDQVEPVWIADVTVHEVTFMNRPKPSLRYGWRRGGFGSDPNDMRGSMFRLSEEILNSGALRDLGLSFRAEYWVQRRAPQDAALIGLDFFAGQGGDDRG